MTDDTEMAVSFPFYLCNLIILCLQVALTEAKDHVSEMNDGKEVNIYF